MVTWITLINIGIFLGIFILSSLLHSIRIIRIFNKNVKRNKVFIILGNIDRELSLETSEKFTALVKSDGFCLF